MGGVTLNQFREDFDEFSDVNAYKSSTINFWLKIAQGDDKTTPPLSGMLNADRWGDQYALATELFVAHNLVLEALARRGGKNGGIAGLTSGIPSSKSVDRVSVSYDTTAAINPEAGHWNLSVYGLRLYQMMQIYGMTVIQLYGACAVSPFFSPSSYSGPWPGV